MGPDVGHPGRVAHHGEQRRSGECTTIGPCEDASRMRFGKVYGPAVVANVGPRCEILGKAAEMA